jgi:hypothetical protein
MNTENLMRALSDVDDKYIEESSGGSACRTGRLTHLKIWKVALIAAVIVSLMTAAAYAAGWFGLSSRVEESDLPGLQAVPEEDSAGEMSVSGFMPLNGYKDSPEAMALAEWLEFRFQYLNSANIADENDLSFAENKTEEKYAAVYSAYDRTMLEKLMEISSKYNVKLYTDRVTPPGGMDSFYEITGMNPFINIDGGENYISPIYVYEDGAFKCEGIFESEDAECSYAVIRSGEGFLNPSGVIIFNIGGFEEWQYMTSCGVNVNIALEKEADEAGLNRFYIITDYGKYFETITASVKLSEEAGSHEDVRKLAEFLADSIDYKELSAGAADISPLIDTGPAYAKPKEGILTLEAFRDTLEYRASSEFSSFYRDFILEDDNLKAVYGHCPAVYCFAPFSGESNAVYEKFNEIAEKYSLLLPAESSAASSDGFHNWAVPVKCMRPDGDLDRNGAHCSPYEKFIEIDSDYYYETAGLENFSPESEPGRLVKYDNGAFYMRCCHPASAVYDLHYVPKGSFYPLISPIETDDMAWRYDTSCGEQVFIAMGGSSSDPLEGYRCIIYETDTAYVLVMPFDVSKNEIYRMETLADAIDFTKFK